MKHVLMVLALIYSILCLLPASTLWYSAGMPIFQDAVQGGTPALSYSRVIHRPTFMSYSVTVRDASDQTIICDGRGGPFNYVKGYGMVVGKNLAWWLQSDRKCVEELSVGSYIVETQWVVEQPLGDLLPHPLDDYLGWLIPPKRIEVTSPLFRILAE